MKITKRWIDFGTEVEMEHTSSRKHARKIALDHLKESPNYYKDWHKKARAGTYGAVSSARRALSGPKEAILKKARANPRVKKFPKVMQARISAKIARLVSEGMDQQQAIAEAINMARAGRLGPRGGYHRVHKNPIEDRNLAPVLAFLMYLRNFPTWSENVPDRILTILIDEGLYTVDDGVTEKGEKFIEHACSETDDERGADD